ncbi:hypothetical protein FJY63_05165 [Candidatus Sumerlaeota bacterium]|nr:hypothetical protein [Candidatus Sumerlaeota bacterium]
MRETKFWTWHILAGAVVLVLLGLHMIVMHMGSIVGLLNPAGGEPIAWANVLARSRMVGLVAVYILLLGAALYHGLYGLRTILLEMGPGAALQKAINVLFWIGGLSLFVIGTLAAIVAAR